MEMIKECGICGIKIAKNRCKLCGINVCNNCYDKIRMLCSNCKR